MISAIALYFQAAIVDNQVNRLNNALDQRQLLIYIDEAHIHAEINLTPKQIFIGENI